MAVAQFINQKKKFDRLVKVSMPEQQEEEVALKIHCNHRLSDDGY